MRRPKLDTSITIRLSDTERELIEAAAEREDRSASAWVRRALKAVAASAPDSASPSHPLLPGGQRADGAAARAG